jgi:hypothetical protein
VSQWVLENSLVAGALALLVALAARLLALRPAVAHGLWLATLGALFMPRLPWIEMPGAALRSRVRVELLGPAAGPARATGEPLREASAPLQLGELALEAAAVPDAAPRLPGGPASALPLAGRAWSLAGLARLLGALTVLARSLRRLLPFQRLVRSSPLAPRRASSPAPRRWPS